MFDIDDAEIYDINTGETVGEIENLTEKQLKEILEVYENEYDKKIEY